MRRGYLAMWRENLVAIIAIVICVGVLALVVYFAEHKGSGGVYPGRGNVPTINTTTNP